MTSRMRSISACSVLVMTQHDFDPRALTQPSNRTEWARPTGRPLGRAIHDGRAPKNMQCAAKRVSHPETPLRSGSPSTAHRTPGTVGGRRRHGRARGPRWCPAIGPGAPRRPDDFYGKPGFAVARLQIAWGDPRAGARAALEDVLFASNASWKDGRRLRELATRWARPTGGSAGSQPPLHRSERPGSQASPETTEPQRQYAVRRAIEPTPARQAVSRRRRHSR